MSNNLRKRRKPRGKRSVDGDKFKSVLERNTLYRLRELGKKGGVNVSYETSVIPYTVRKNYNPDFTCIFRNGKTIFIETKGWFRPEDRAKMLAVKHDNPGLDIRLVFPVNNKLNARSNTRYSDWCEKHGFTYCIGQVPADWLKL